MSKENLKLEVLKYIKNFHTKKKKPPSIRQIIKKCKITFTIFYRLFPKGITEACRLAGVSVNQQRVNQTKKALQSKREKEEEKRDSGDHNSISRLMLTEEQTKRVYGIKQLEGGKDSLQIMDDLLNLDTKARKIKLSLTKRKQVSDFLERALEIGWKTKTTPSILKSLTRAHNLSILLWPPDMFNKILTMLECAVKSKWKPDDFVNYVTQFQNLLTWYSMAKKNIISRQEFERRASKYV